MCRWNGDRDRTPCLDPVIGICIQTILTNAMSRCRKKERRERKPNLSLELFHKFSCWSQSYVRLCKEICYAFPDHFRSFRTDSTICLIFSYSWSGVLAHTSFGLSFEMGRRLVYETNRSRESCNCASAFCSRFTSETSARLSTVNGYAQPCFEQNLFSSALAVLHFGQYYFALACGRFCSSEIMMPSWASISFFKRSPILFLMYRAGWLFRVHWPSNRLPQGKFWQLVCVMRNAALSQCKGIQSFNLRRPSFEA